MERELWRILSGTITKLDRSCDVQDYDHSIGRIVRVYLWAVLHDRPVYWACRRRNWAGVRPPVALPDQSTMSRRLRRRDTRDMITALSKMLDRPDLSTRLCLYLDGKPLPISKHSVDAQATFGRGAGGQDRGYKLHAIYGESNRPVAWSLRPLNENEHHAAKPLVESLDEGYLLADANYDANHLYEQAGRKGVRLLTSRRYASARGIGRHAHSAYRLDALNRLSAPSPFARELLQQRRRVETRFAHLSNFGGGLTCLPPWVRGLHRVTLWVAGKILVRLARDIFIKRTRA